MSSISDLQILCITALEHLPDSNLRRRAVLRAAIEMLPANDAIRQHAFVLLKLLDTFDAEQRELPFNKAGDGDGHHKKGDGQ
jgi:hypothetical protein